MARKKKKQDNDVSLVSTKGLVRTRVRLKKRKPQKIKKVVGFKVTKKGVKYKYETITRRRLPEIEVKVDTEELRKFARKRLQVPKAPARIAKKYLVGKQLTFKIGRVR